MMHMEICEFYIYKNQFNNKQFRMFLRKLLDVTDEKYILPHMLDERRMITLTENFNLRVVAFEGGVDEYKDVLIEGLKNNLNAEKFLVKYNGNEQWYECEKFNMKFTNKVKHIIHEWTKMN